MYVWLLCKSSFKTLSGHKLHYKYLHSYMRAVQPPYRDESMPLLTLATTSMHYTYSYTGGYMDGEI